MPRPNPPRKRPRNRPRGSQRAARTDAALNRQTAQSTQGKTPAAPAPQRPAATAAAAPASPDELWSRRSYAILVAIVAVLEIPITAIQWAFQPAVTNGVTKAPLQEVIPFINPISLLIACLLAAPIAKSLSGEKRSLRFLETITVGVVTFFIYLLLATGVGLLVAPSSPVASTPIACTGSSSGAATPLSASASAGASTATPCPSPAPTASAGASPRASASPSPASGSAAGTVNASSIPGILAAFSVADVIAYGLTVYIYPPLYKRLRLKPRTPPPPRQKKPDRK